MTSLGGIRVSGMPGEFVPWHPLPNLAEPFELLSLDSSLTRLTARFLTEGGRGLTLSSSDIAAIRTIVFDASDALAVAAENELLPYGRSWELCGAPWSDDETERPGHRHFVLLTSSVWFDLLTSGAVHLSWDDNFFGDAV